MKTVLLTLCMVLIFVLNVFSQAVDSSISMNGIDRDLLVNGPVFRSLKGVEYSQNGQVKTFEEIKMKLKNDPTSYFEFDKYTRRHVGSNVCYTIGCLGIIAGGITYLTSKEQFSDRQITGLGILIGGCVPIIFGSSLHRSAKRHFLAAIDIYNSKLSSSRLNTVQFNFMANSNGLGIRMSF